MKEEGSSLLKKYKNIFEEEFEAASVEEALKIALQSLKMSKEELDFKVLFEGEPGLFGLKGIKPAKIKVYPKIDKLENLIKYYILKLLGFVKEKISFVNINISDSIEIEVIFEDKITLNNLRRKNVFEAVNIIMENFTKKFFKKNVRISFESVRK